jgi:hypothetical protein
MRHKEMIEVAPSPSNPIIASASLKKEPILIVSFQRAGDHWRTGAPKAHEKLDSST